MVVLQLPSNISSPLPQSFDAVYQSQFLTPIQKPFSHIIYPKQFKLSYKIYLVQFQMKVSSFKLRKWFTIYRYVNEYRIPITLLYVSISTGIPTSNLKECHPRCVYRNYSRSMIREMAVKTQPYL